MISLFLTHPSALQPKVRGKSRKTNGSLKRRTRLRRDKTRRDGGRAAVLTWKKARALGGAEHLLHLGSSCCFLLLLLMICCPLRLRVRIHISRLLNTIFRHTHTLSLFLINSNSCCFSVTLLHQQNLIQSINHPSWLLTLILQRRRSTTLALMPAMAMPSTPLSSSMLLRA